MNYLEELAQSEIGPCRTMTGISKDPSPPTIAGAADELNGKTCDNPIPGRDRNHAHPRFSRLRTSAIPGKRRQLAETVSYPLSASLTGTAGVGGSR